MIMTIFISSVLIYYYNYLGITHHVLDFASFSVSFAFEYSIIAYTGPNDTAVLGNIV